MYKCCSTGTSKVTRVNKYAGITIAYYYCTFNTAVLLHLSQCVLHATTTAFTVCHWTFNKMVKISTLAIICYLAVLGIV